MQKLRIIEYVNFALAAILFLVGFVTLFFTKIPGNVDSVAHSFTSQNGYSGAYYDQYVHKGSTMNWTTINYSYEVDEKYYSSSFYGFKLPIAVSSSIQKGGKIDVWIVPGFPELSILSRGPSWAIISFLLVGAGLRALRHWLLSRIHA